KTRIYQRGEDGKYELRQTLSEASDGVWSVTFSKDAGTLATGSRDKETRIYQRGENGEYELRQILPEAEGVVGSVFLSEDAGTLATGSGDKKTRIYQRGEDGKYELRQTLSGAGGNVQSVTFSEDAGTLATGSEDKKARIYQRGEDGKYELRQTLSEAGDVVVSVFLSEDVGTLATGSGDKKTRIYQRGEDGKYELRQTLSEASDGVSSVFLSGDAGTLATGSGDKKTRIYQRGENGKYELRQTLPEARDWVLSVTFSEDGSRLIAGVGNERGDTGTGGVRVYRLKPEIEARLRAAQAKAQAQSLGQANPDLIATPSAGEEIKVRYHVDVFAVTNQVTLDVFDRSAIRASDEVRRRVERLRLLRSVISAEKNDRSGEEKINQALRKFFSSKGIQIPQDAARRVSLVTTGEYLKASVERTHSLIDGLASRDQVWIVDEASMSGAHLSPFAKRFSDLISLGRKRHIAVSGLTQKSVARKLGRQQSGFSLFDVTGGERLDVNLDGFLNIVVNASELSADAAGQKIFISALRLAALLSGRDRERALQAMGLLGNGVRWTAGSLTAQFLDSLVREVSAAKQISVNA
ncbi:MAG: hypothetical protein HZC17_02275, partial [Candidatus Omnitrophica bacterium]|nr:hypothetical protein [Candidatus Omnitrophota bacterium]